MNGSGPRLSDRQHEVLVESTGRVNIFDGSISSGKTIVSLLRWLLFVAKAPTGGALVIVGRTRDSAWRNAIGPLQDPELFGVAAAQVVGNHGAPTVTILGRRVYVLGASDAKAEKVLRGLTVAGVYVDEVTTLPEEFFTQLLGRMRVAGARLFGTTNPDSPGHWLKAKFLDRLEQLPDWRRFHMSLDDNPALEPGYVAAIKREFTGLWYRRFILGEWVQAEGAIYDSWDPARHVIPASALPTMERVLALGVDQGTTNATRGLLVGLAQQKLWTIGEWAPQTGLTDAVQSLSLRRWLVDQPPPEWLFVDPAAASFRLQLFEDGMSNVAPASNAVLPGIRTVSSLLATDRIKVVEGCTNLIREIPGYSWDPKATAKGEDVPIKRDDHAVDGWRYAVHSSRALWRNHIPALAASPHAPGADDDIHEEAA